MDSDIPANPAYGVYITQLVRYNARICTSKVDFINRLRGLSLSVSDNKALKPIYFRNHIIYMKYIHG